jgi:hypothetical protein
MPTRVVAAAARDGTRTAAPATAHRRWMAPAVCQLGCDQLEPNRGRLSLSSAAFRSARISRHRRPLALPCPKAAHASAPAFL